LERTAGLGSLTFGQREELVRRRWFETSITEAEKEAIQWGADL